MNNSSKVSCGAAILGTSGALALLGTTDVFAADDNVIAEIVVSAQKRTESLQEVPASVSVLGEQQLVRLHATQLADYATYMPGINIGSGGTPGQTTITLRGIAPVGPGSVVGTYIDDTPLGASNNFARATFFALDMMPYDLERIEVLRGPQGTLYGAGSMGGLLKYVMRDPSTDALEFRAGLEGFDIAGADDAGWGARAGANVPLSPTVAVRASYFAQSTPGYIDNVATGEQDENELEQSGGRASLLWKASDTVELTLGGLWQRLDSDNNASMALELTSIDPPRGRRNLGDLQTSHPISQQFSKDVDYYFATLNWNLGRAEFVSASSYSETRTRQQQDASITYGSLFPLLTGGLVPEGLSRFNIRLDLEKWTQEFRLASSSDDRIQWRVGAFYTEEDSDNLQLVDAMDVQRQPIEVFLPYLALAALPTQYREFAAFGDVTYKFSESFDVIAGLRWAANEQKFHQISGGVLLPTEDMPGESDEDVFTYALSPRWHLNADTMLYMRIASGYRPGGPNIVLPGVPPQVEADELTNYELGLKSVFAAGRARINAAVFYIDWQDIQQLQGFGGVSALDNAGDTESRGIEFESLFSVTHGLQLGLNFAYTDAVLKSSPPELDNKFDVQLPEVPQWSGAITADYSFTAFGGRDAHVGAGWRYVDERQSEVVTFTDNLSYRLPAYDVLDLNADVQFDAVSVRVFVKNVMDERAFTGGGTTVDGLNFPIRLDLIVLQPRTVGLSIDTKF